MILYKNTASQKAYFYAYDYSTGAPKTGDAGNITAYVAKDYGSATILGDTSATEVDSTNAKGYYVFDLTQSETNADVILFTAKSSTANVNVLGAPATVGTKPTTGFLSPATLGRTVVVDAAGLVDANAVKVGPSGSGTAQTARDIGASVIAASVSSGGIASASFAAETGLRPSRSNTAASGTSASITLDAGASSVDDFYAGQIIFLTGGAGAWQARTIDTYAGSGKTAGVSPNWSTAPDNTTTFAILPNGNPTGVHGSVTGSVASVTGSVGGNVVGSVGSVTGLTASNLDVAVSTRAPESGGNVAAIKAKTDNLPSDPADASDVAAAFAALNDLDAADVRSAVGLASANLDTQLAAIQADSPNRVTKNTAFSAFTFVMVDATDNVSPKTGLTVTATRSLDGGAFASCANSVSEIGSGAYKIDLATTDTNANDVLLKFAATGAAVRFVKFVTQPT